MKTDTSNRKTPAVLTGGLAAIALATGVGFSAPAAAVGLAQYEVLAGLYFATDPALSYNITVAPLAGDCDSGYGTCSSLTDGTASASASTVYEPAPVGAWASGGNTVSGSAANIADPTASASAVSFSSLGWEVTTTGTNVDLSGLSFVWNLSGALGVGFAYGLVYGQVGWQLFDGETLLQEFVIDSFEREIDGGPDTYSFVKENQTYTFGTLLLSAGQKLVISTQADGIADVQGVPEPTTLALLGAGLVGVAVRRSAKRA